MEEAEEKGIALVAKLELEGRPAGERDPANFPLFYFLHDPTIPSLTFRLDALPTHAPRPHMRPHAPTSHVSAMFAMSRYEFIAYTVVSSIRLKSNASNKIR